MKFSEVMKRLEDSGIGHAAEVVEIRIETTGPMWMPPPAPGAKPQENLTVVVRA